MESNVKSKELENRKVINKGSYWADVKGHKISLGRNKFKSSIVQHGDYS